MKKISTLYQKDPNDLGRVINKVNPENEWVFESGIPTKKYDGTACAIIEGQLYKRYDCKINKQTGEYKKPIPDGAISCQEPDYKSGHHPHWILCDRSDNSNKYHFEAYDNLLNSNIIDGTYELIGPKIQGNPEKSPKHKLVPHGSYLIAISDFSFQSIKQFLESEDIEGIVFWERNGDRTCKIRKSDFGIKR